MENPGVEPYAALVLTGGRSRRMGRDKAGLVHRGDTLLEHALRASSGAVVRVIVGPHRAEGTITVQEAPPFGGPVAGIAAGISCLEGFPDPHAVATDHAAQAKPPVPVDHAVPVDHTVPANHAVPVGWVLVLACDHPRVGEAVPDLLGGRSSVPDSADGCVAVDHQGRRQHLLGCYRRSALLAALNRLDGVRNSSMRELVSGLDLTEVPLSADIAGDIDDAEQARAYGIGLDPLG